MTINLINKRTRQRTHRIKLWFFKNVLRNNSQNISKCFASGIKCLRFMLLVNIAISSGKTIK